MWWWVWKSKKKIEEDNKNVKYRYIQGPTGPQGSPGPLGPQGPIGSTEIVAYAERYLDEKRDLKLETQVDTIVPLTSNGPAFFADYNTENSIDIREPGLYQISYYFSATPKNDCKLTVSIRNNDLLIPASNIVINWQANSIGNVSNRVLTALIKEDVLTLSIRAESETDLSFGDNTNAVLTIVKVH